MASTENKFQAVGRNLISISNMLLSNQNICKLLYYTTSTPLSEPDLTDVDFLMNKNIRLVPKVPDRDSEKGSFIVVLFDNFTVDPTNENIKIVSLRFDIICPIDEWMINESSLRPFLILSEIDQMFNGLQIRGIGKLRLSDTDRIVVTEDYAGYSMVFTNYEFN